MTLHRWDELDREVLRSVLPKALVILPLGATEQHGPHLPAGTDFFIASAAAARAAEAVASRTGVDLVMAPPIGIGASDHHLPFGGTVSLRARTMLMVLEDVIDSMATSGVRRMVMVNGHGGNVGLCSAAAAAATSRHDMAVAHIDYWRVMAGRPDVPNVPGHAGQFETSLVLALRPDLVRERPRRRNPGKWPSPVAVDVHSAAHWRAIDGYTDSPDEATAVLGQDLLAELVGALASRLVELEETL